MSNPKNLYYRMKRRLNQAIKEHNTTLTCEKCSGTWSPIIRAGGRMPNGWWVCPHCGNRDD